MSSGLRSESWKPVYRTGDDDLFLDFYSKAFGCSVSYDRAVGFFSSRLLAAAFQGVSKFISNNGKIRLIIGSPLEEEEFMALQHGETLRTILSEHDRKLRAIFEPGDTLDKKRLKILAWMFSVHAIEIRYAFRRKGMYHEKIGIFYDEEGNSIVFQGSANETPSAMMKDSNAESIMVFRSWEKEIFESYGASCVNSFEELWNGQQHQTITVDILSETYKQLASIGDDYKQDVFSIDEEFDYLANLELKKHRKHGEPYIPETIGGTVFSVRQHQRDALTAWKRNGYQGILQLATGAGKTITSIYGAVKIFEATKRLALIVSVPYIDLANQWVSVLEEFGITSLKCYESSSSWSLKFDRFINLFNGKSIRFLCVVVVNRTLVSDNFQSRIKRISDNDKLFIGDECHNHGSNLIRSNLPEAKYRIGLSATPYRSDEDEIESPFPNYAKKNIISYYQSVCYEYDLEDAINDGILTPYNYYIVPVEMTLEEHEEYRDLTRKIANALSSNGESSQQLTMLCGQRSRLLGGLSGKPIALKEILSTVSPSDKQHTLFYCGEGKLYNSDEQAIHKVSKVLSNSGWRISTFTSKESRKERREILAAFKDGLVDGLVSMKVLDEGVDIPACRTAFILASTRNPRQYVQRRGRILRKSPDKKIAKIYDFVVLPPSGLGSLDESTKSLVRAEYERVSDFTRLSNNRLEIENVISNLELDI